MQKLLTLLSKNPKTPSLQGLKAISQQVASIVFHKSNARANVSWVVLLLQRKIPAIKLLTNLKSYYFQLKHALLSIYICENSHFNLPMKSFIVITVNTYKTRSKMI
jgi:hypothetical protein